MPPKGSRKRHSDEDEIETIGYGESFILHLKDSAGNEIKFTGYAEKIIGEEERLKRENQALKDKLKALENTTPKKDVA
jgi:hypothetical protein